MKGLQQIYNKGIGAYKTNPQSVRPNVTSKEQWAMARVYSAVMGGKASRIDENELKMNHGGGVGQEITCQNCGWHWNTNQSKEYDKYVCHNCGTDNSKYYSNTKK
jgi:DNA-directed RNA polymerase subunit RPC12/RpoP